jgi:PAS domain S-box-containing protein
MIEFNIIESIPLSTILIDDMQRISFINSLGLKLLDNTQSELQHKSIEHLFPEINLCITNDSKEVTTFYCNKLGEKNTIKIKFVRLDKKKHAGLLYLFEIEKNYLREKKLSELKSNFYKKKLHFFETFLNLTDEDVRIYNHNGQLIYINKIASSRIGISPNHVKKHYVWEIEDYFSSKEDWLNQVTILKIKNEIHFSKKHTLSSTTEVIDLLVSFNYQIIDHQEYFVSNYKDITENLKNKILVTKKAKQIDIYNKNTQAVTFQLVVKSEDINYFSFIGNAFKAQFGFSIPLKNKDWISHLNLHPDDLVSFLNTINASIINKIDFIYIGRFVMPSGNIKWFEASALRIDEDQEVIYDGIIIDITTKKESEIEISNKRIFNDSILDNIPADIAVFDKNHNYLFINSTGIANEELRKWLIGKNDFDYCAYRNLDTTIAQKRHEYFQIAIDTKKQFDWIDEIKKEDKVVHVLRRFYPFFIKDKFVYMIGYGIDITELKNTQAIITKNENRNRLILQSALDAIIMINSNDEIIFWNPQAELVFGWKSEEVIGQLFSEIINPKSINDLNNGTQQQKYNDGHQEYRFNELMELNARKKNKEEFSIELTILPIEDEIQGITFCAFIRDINHRKSREKEINRQNKILKLQNTELEQFTYLTSHDLQEPLLTLTSFAELLLEEHTEALNDEGKLFVEYINKSADRMRKLVAGLMEYARIGKNEIPTILNCEQIVNEVILDLNVKITQYNAIVDVKYLPQLNGFKTDIRLLFQNLISNAIKFSKENATPTITISCNENSNEYVFCVEDNGIGIDKNNIEQIFIIFKQLNNRENYTGYGIGLAHCKKIIELHGGEIWVESVLGKGSQFKFSIPKNLTIY